ANPYAEIMSMQMLLAWLGRRNDDPRLVEAARAIEAAALTVIAQRVALTADLGGSARTQDMGAAIADLVPGLVARA
ncbi:MAG: isocitrate/isopropylmalate family dehydrogenase, partial [Geminicoccaceae bacterium]